MPSTPFIGDADLVAHGGEELALGLAGGLGRLLGQHQLRGAGHDLVLQTVALGLQALVALVNLFEHRVEAAAQGRQFRDPARLRAQPCSRRRQTPAA